jgi:phosphatidylglycerol:prolipoprotein diacylglycerol transferase
MGHLGIVPVVLHLGYFDIRWYGLAYIAALFWLWRYSARLIANAKLWHPRTAPLDLNQLDALIFWIAIALIFGAKCGYVIFHWDSRHYFGQFLTSNGGMSSLGGITGIFLVTVAFCQRMKISWLRTMDALIVAAPISILIIRIANLINGELGGTAAILEIIFEGVVPFVLFRYVVRHSHFLSKPGLLTGTFTFYYAVMHVVFEGFRPQLIDGSGTNSGNEYVQFAGLAVAGLLLLALSVYRVRRRLYSKIDPFLEERSPLGREKFCQRASLPARVRTAASIVLLSTPLYGCSSGNNSDVPNLPAAQPVTVVTTNPGADSQCTCQNSAGAYLQNSSSTTQQANWVVNTEDTTTGANLNPEYGTSAVPPNGKTFIGCTIFAPTTSCRFSAQYSLNQVSRLRVARASQAAVYGSLATPSISACTAWCNDPDNPQSGACLPLGVRFYQAIAPISQMVAALNGNGKVAKADILKRYGVPASYDQCQRGDIMVQNGTAVNEGVGQACMIPSEDLPKSLADRLHIQQSDGSPLKQITVLPRRIEAESAPASRALNSGPATYFDKQETAPIIVFDGAGGLQVTQNYGGTVIAAAHVAGTGGLPNRTIIATSNGCIAVDEP